MWAPHQDTPPFPDGSTRTREEGKPCTDVVDFRAAEPHSIGVECPVAGKRRGHERTAAPSEVCGAGAGWRPPLPTRRHQTSHGGSWPHPDGDQPPPSLNSKPGIEAAPPVDTPVTSLRLPPAHGSLPPSCGGTPRPQSPHPRRTVQGSEADHRPSPPAQHHDAPGLGVDPAVVPVRPDTCGAEGLVTRRQRRKPAGRGGQARAPAACMF